MWWKIILFIILGLMVTLALILVYGSNRRQTDTREMLSKLEASRLPVGVKKYSPKNLVGLPAPVQRYFKKVLKDGQSMIAAVTVEHSGTFNISETGEQWKPFTSIQRVITRPPGFDWEGRIEMMPGLTIQVHDAYIAGEGILHATLFGVVSLVNLRGTPDMAHGELMRFFAETAWYPTALLPSQGVRWEPVNESSAKATLKDGETTVTLLFRFNEKDLIESVRAEARGRAIAGEVIPTPWEGRWINYDVYNDMHIPIEGEVVWLLPEGPKPYWRGRVTKISYEFER